MSKRKKENISMTLISKEVLDELKELDLQVSNLIPFLALFQVFL